MADWRRSRYARSRYDAPVPFLVRAGSIGALLGVIVLFAGPVGYRLGALSLHTAADRVFVWGAYLGGCAAAVSMVGLLAVMLSRRGERRGIGRAVLAVLVGALTLRAGGRLPFAAPSTPLPDVTTDTRNPPTFVARPLSPGETSTPPAYPGEPLATRQREAYPDIETLVVTRTRDEVFARAVTAVRDLGWTLVTADGPTGRIEARASTTLFGTIDDVVVRVEAQESGSRIDVRSVSRERDGLSTRTVDRVRAILSALAPT